MKIWRETAPEIFCQGVAPAWSRWHIADPFGAREDCSPYRAAVTSRGHGAPLNGIGRQRFAGGPCLVGELHASRRRKTPTSN